MFARARHSRPRAMAALTYSVVDLGFLTDLSGRSESRPYAINNTGQVSLTNVTGGAYALSVTKARRSTWALWEATRASRVASTPAAV